MSQPNCSSLWASTAAPDIEASALQEIVPADVVIVGAGFTGCAAALAMAQRGARVRLLEANVVGWGASGRTGGQVIPGLKFDPDEIEAMFGPDLGPRMVNAVGSVGDEVFGLIEQHAISCDAQRKGWLQPAFSTRSLNLALRRCESWQRRGADVAPVDRSEMARLLGTDHYLGGWEDRRAGHVQPMSYVRGLAGAAQRAGAVIHIDSPALSLTRQGTKWRVSTPQGAVDADQVLLATNGYTDGLWPGLARTVVPMMSFQAATVPISEDLGKSILPEGHAASDTRRLLWYFRRDAHGRLTMGGRAPYREDLGAADADYVRNAVNRLYPQLSGTPFEFHWAGRVAMTQDHIPHLNRLDNGLWAALGYNGRGVGMATLFGRYLADLATGVPAEGIPFPVTSMRPIQGYPFTRLVARALVSYYRIRDQLEAA
ncbi:NAD(P)/FAD-dependent oxidoreductase [Rhodoferax ferrireducens]|uniref:NAD(P)/FAD-dependent oxidoreductase n=1 Tax=Rhodoferax ferrireducens TaxID=192843 RepID=UPI003BB57185